MKGNDQQLRFADEYVVDGYGIRAAIRAGYAPEYANQRASVLLRDPDMILAVLEAAERLKKREPLCDRVLRQLSKLADKVDIPATQWRRRQRVKGLRRKLGLPEPVGLVVKDRILPAEAVEVTVPDPPPEHFGVFAGLLPPARYKGAYGGRGSGKSHFFAEQLVRRCLKGPVRAVCIREVQRSLDQSVKRLIEDKIQALGVGDRFTVQQAIGG
jgi:phage terminase large subunit